MSDLKNLKDQIQAEMGADVAQGWPGGWYIYENGKVEGPFAATEAFNRPTDASSGKPRLVSRKGFSQWYALKDLSEIFRMTENLGRQATAAAVFTENQMARFRNEAAGNASAAAPSLVQEAPVVRSSETQGPPPKVQPRKIELKKADVAPMPAPAAAAPTPAPEAAPVVAVQPDEGETVVSEIAEFDAAAAAAQAYKDAVQEDLERQAEERRKEERSVDEIATTVSAKSSVTSSSPMQEYFLVRNRLRLGKLRNPWVTAFVGVPLSVGIYWAAWVAQMSREVAWHSRNEPRKTAMTGVLAMIPIVHFFVIHRLAKSLREMETQNKYATVSPTVACLFGIFPPFALAYLQDAANRHWMLHARFSMVRPVNDPPRAAEA